MKKQMTNWFPGKIKPIHKGVYQVREKGFPMEVRFSFWNGNFWGFYEDSLSDAKRSKSNPFADQSKQWRGFTEKQK